MRIPASKPHVFSRTRVLETSAGLSVIGMTGLVLAGVLGFEKPSDTLLVVSSILIFAAPVAILAHLALTSELSREEKRIWIRELTGSRAPWVFSTYVTCRDPRAAARGLAEESPPKNAS